jgi:ATP-dependent Lon protease
LGLSEEAIRSGVHIHVPAGAIPKDGPSAGVAMATALVSMYAVQPVRNDTAMTGEITLTGLVLPVGGIKEKVLAASRSKLKRVILPKRNRKDWNEVPAEVRKQIKADFVDHVAEAIPLALHAK